MLTKVILDGPMGKQFGKHWELAVNSPSEALRMIDANQPGVFAWIKMNLDKYERYKVVVTYHDGRTEELNEDEYRLERSVKSIRFTPIVEGAGGNGVGQTILGIVLIVVGVFTTIFGDYSGSVIALGVSLLVGGVAQMLAPKPKMNDFEQAERKDKTSYYFDGPANTTMQGVPVQLIYGRCMVGSHGISAALTVDQLM